MSSLEMARDTKDRIFGRFLDSCAGSIEWYSKERTITFKKLKKDDQKLGPKSSKNLYDFCLVQIVYLKRNEGYSARRVSISKTPNVFSSSLGYNQFSFVF